MNLANIIKFKVDINEKLSKISKGRKILIILSIIIFFSLVTAIQLFIGTYNVLADDGCFHLSRLAGTETIFRSKQFLPLIVPMFCNNFGYGTNIFYSPLTAVIPLIFRLFTFDIIAITKIIIVLSSYLSGLSMYFFIKKVTNNDLAGIIGAVLYIICPYRLNDIYFRNAIPEYISFIFLPMIFNGLYTIVNKKEKSNLLVIGSVLLLLTHTLTTFFTAIMCFLYIIANYKCLKNKEVLKNLSISILLIILLSAFYIGPFIEHKLKTDYVVFDSDYMVELDRLELFKLDFNKLYRSAEVGLYNFSIGFALTMGLVLIFLVVKDVIKKDYKIIYFYSLIMGFFLLLISSKLFPYEKLPKLFLMIQFPFRFLELINLFFILVASINLSLVLEKYPAGPLILMFIFLVVTDIAPFAVYHYDELNFGIELFYEAVPVKEIKEYPSRHLNLAQYEYLPKKALNNTGYIEKRYDEPIILDSKGSIAISDFKKENTNTYFVVSDAKKGDIIELPYIYYLGYRVKVNGKEINTFESENGFVAFKFDEDIDHAEVNTRYLGTNFMLISYLISFATLVYLAVNKYTKKTKKNIKDDTKEKVKSI